MSASGSGFRYVVLFLVSVAIVIGFGLWAVGAAMAGHTLPAIGLGTIALIGSGVCWWAGR